MFPLLLLVMVLFHYLLLSVCKGVILYSDNDDVTSKGGLHDIDVARLVNPPLLDDERLVTLLSFEYIDWEEGNALMRCPSLLERLSEQQMKSIKSRVLFNAEKRKKDIELRRANEVSRIVNDIFGNDLSGCDDGGDDEDGNGDGDNIESFIQTPNDAWIFSNYLLTKGNDQVKKGVESYFKVADKVVSDALKTIGGLQKMEKSYFLTGIVQKLLMKNSGKKKEPSFYSSSSDDDQRWVVSIGDGAQTDSDSDSTSASFSSFHKSSSSDDWSNSSGLGDSTSDDSEIDL